MRCSKLWMYWLDISFSQLGYCNKKIDQKKPFSSSFNVRDEWGLCFVNIQKFNTYKRHINHKCMMMFFYWTKFWLEWKKFFTSTRKLSLFSFNPKFYHNIWASTNWLNSTKTSPFPPTCSVSTSISASVGAFGASLFAPSRICFNSFQVFILVQKPRQTRSRWNNQLQF